MGIVKKLTYILATMLITLAFTIPFNLVYADDIIDNDFIISIRQNLVDMETYQTKYSTTYFDGNISDSNHYLYVYDYNGKKLGKFAGYHSTGNATSTPYFTLSYLSSSNTLNSCTTCYLSFDSNTSEVTSITNKDYYIYEYVIVFKHNYIGSITINNITYGVNGNELRFNSRTNYNTFSFDNINLVNNDNLTWHFPFESFSAVNYLYSEYDVVGLRNTFDYYLYPIFNIPSNGYISRMYPMSSDNLGYTIFACNKDVNMNTFNNLFYFQQSEVRLEDIEVVQPYGSGWGVYKIIVSKNGGTLSAVIRNSVDMLVMPIYVGTSDNLYLSTEFATSFGLQNEFLLNIDKLVNGDTQSISTDLSATQKNNQLSNTMSSYDNMSQQYTNSFNESLNNIDTSFNINEVSGFLNASNWVKLQFDRLSSHQPIRLLVTFALMLGLSSLLLARRSG